MKVRNGFVSNSSSASFFIALGRVESKTRFEQVVNEFTSKGKNVSIRMGTPAELSKTGEVDVRRREDGSLTISKSSFLENYDVFLHNVKDDDVIFCLDGYESAGYDEYGDVIYYDDFTTEREILLYLKETFAVRDVKTIRGNGYS